MLTTCPRGNSVLCFSKTDERKGSIAGNPCGLTTPASTRFNVDCTLRRWGSWGILQEWDKDKRQEYLRKMSWSISFLGPKMRIMVIKLSCWSPGSHGNSRVIHLRWSLYGYKGALTTDDVWPVLKVFKVVKTEVTNILKSKIELTFTCFNEAAVHKNHFDLGISSHIVVKRRKELAMTASLEATSKP